MTWAEFCEKIASTAGIPYNTVFGWKSRGFVKNIDNYSDAYLNDVIKSIPYCCECNTRLPMGSCHSLCEKCNASIMVSCEKCGTPVHKYWNRKIIQYPLCRKCSLNMPHVIKSVSEGAKKSWKLNYEKRRAATAGAVQTDEHRRKMRKSSLKMWEDTDLREKMKRTQHNTIRIKWEQSGRKEYPHATRLSLHVFRCNHCGTVYADMNMDNTRQPSTNYCPHCHDYLEGGEAELPYLGAVVSLPHIVRFPGH